MGNDRYVLKQVGGATLAALGMLKGKTGVTIGDLAKVLNALSNKNNLFIFRASALIEATS